MAIVQESRINKKILDKLKVKGNLNLKVKTYWTAGNPYTTKRRMREENKAVRERVKIKLKRKKGK